MVDLTDKNDVFSEGTTPGSTDGTDTVNGKGGDDIINGGKGDDVLHGGTGNDKLTGGENFDTLFGDKGDDILQGAGGGVITFSNTATDVLDGGDGNDTMLINYNGFKYVSDDKFPNFIIDISIGQGSVFADGLQGENFTSIERLDIALSGGNDFVTGGALNDIIRVNQGNDKVVAGKGDDEVYDSSGKIDFDGGEGNDLVSFAGEQSVFIDGKTGTYKVGGVDFGMFKNFERMIAAGSNLDDDITGLDGGNTITGGEGTNKLTGGAGKDTITGGTGDDTMVGLGGNDTFSTFGGKDSVDAGGGNDTVNAGTHANVVAGEVYDGGGDSDTLNFSLSSPGTIDFATITVQNFETLQGIGSAGVDTFFKMSTGQFAQFDNVGMAVLFNPLLVGHSTSGIISFTDAASVALDGFISGAKFQLHDSGQSLDGSAVKTFSFFTAFGGSGDDTITGGGGNDVLGGGGGNDILIGGGGTDAASYVGVTASISVSLALQGAAQDTKGAGKDKLSGFENLIGGDGIDEIFGNGADNKLDGGLGADVVSGGAGNDFVRGGFDIANDSLFGQDGADILDGGSGDDILDGGAGNDILMDAGGGNDQFVYDGRGADKIYYTLIPTSAIFTAGAGSIDVIKITAKFSNFDDLKAATKDFKDGVGGTDAVIDFGGGNSLTIANVAKASLHADDFIFDLSAANSPKITSNGGGDSAAISIAENITAVTTVKATDANKDAITYSIVGGVDKDLFVIDDKTGVLAFLAKPDFESPGDLGADNTYNVVVEALAGGDKDTQDITVTVTNVTKETITGKDGSDDLFLGTADTEAFIGLSGTDTVGYSKSDAGLTVNLGTPAKNTGIAKGDTFKDIENLTGSDLSDALTGDAKANTLDGGKGDDTLDGGLGNDALVGGAGNDTASYASLTVAVTASLDSNDATYKNGKADEKDTLSSIEHLTGGGGADKLTGDGKDNVLTGGAGDDQLFGGAGDDTLIGGGGADILDGQTDSGSSDAASYEASAAAVTVDLLAGTAKGGDAGGDTLIEIEDLTGSKSNDILTGDGENNIIDGGLGNDAIAGGAGNDTLTGGAGNDVISGGAGDDDMDGGDGFDTASYADATGDLRLSMGGKFQTTVNGLETPLEFDQLINFEHLIAGAFNDELYGGPDGDKLEGRAGDDLIEGFAGDDILDGGDGDDFVDPGTGNDVLNGGNNGAKGDTVAFLAFAKSVTVSLALKTAQITGDGKDTITGFEHLTGSTVNDVLTGDGNANTIDGDNGNDVIDGGLGNDSLDGGAGGADLVSFTHATSAVSVDLSTFTATQGSGKTLQTDTVKNFEIVLGSNFNDTIVGDGADNVIDGGTGGADMLDGGGEDTSGDTVSYALTKAGVTVDLGVTAQQDTKGGGKDTLSEFENVSGSKFNDVIAGDDGDNVLAGALGVDAVSYANAAADVTVALSAPGPQDTVGAGTDTLFDFEDIVGSKHNDALTGDGKANKIDGGDGDDVIDGGDGNDVLIGGGTKVAPGSDTVSYANATAGVTVDLGLTKAQDTKGAGKDTLSGFENVTGSGFGDLLIGTAGDNVFIGGAGPDIVSYANATAGVTVALGTPGKQDTKGAGLDTLQSIDGLIGSKFADVFSYGDDGIASLSGGLGNDKLTGGLDNDTIDGGGGDDVMDGEAGSSDTASYASMTAAVTVSLLVADGVQQNTGGAGKDTLSKFENLAGGGGADNLTGDGDGNIITGNAGNDKLFGDAGADTLTGGVGSDIIDLGAADSVGDTVRFNSLADKGDTITNFEEGIDAVELVTAGFIGAVVGAPVFIADDGKEAPLPGAAVGTFLYDLDDGKLFYDADGTGKGAAVLLATFTGAPVLTATDLDLV